MSKKLGLDKFKPGLEDTGETPLPYRARIQKDWGRRVSKLKQKPSWLKRLYDKVYNFVWKDVEDTTK